MEEEEKMMEGMEEAVARTPTRTRRRMDEQASDGESQ